MKRCFDLISSLMAIILFSPILLVLALIIKYSSPGPVLFKQRRMGLNNQEFMIYKFRTMRIDTPNVATHLLKNPEHYITPIGKFMRTTSLDELPQLFNILKGEMSVVGPRPALYNQHDLIEMRTKVNVHTVRPGLTGLAQVSGRDELELEKKVYFDQQYLEKQSFFYDLKLILLTIVKVFKSEGIVEGGIGNPEINQSVQHTEI
ncbi:sugar transferase [Turicibacter sanguinis]|uniref:sugar transferase n=1 Tax=Turicibacter sanguinis TaxID=154288 RepID=UPI0012BD6980|nr:sugar transferase [Turicibacter sanguinis]MDB8545632.1 sugar transferase [Turicibacter sanguinis]MTO10804.1 sugar transferase [Turicibacter sanguinis]MTP48339.1 sugar transferase [Turicibacter sanguinis]MTP51058.1 sugar transferase [Turicibacter sanguinis]MTQ08340.1 sugar transferase [Turicibacter sanguinis]